MSWKKSLKFKPFGVPDSTLVPDLESQIGVPLPADYRQFLLKTGGGYLRDGLAECTVHTPFGKSTIAEFHAIEDVIRLLHSTVTPRNMICIGYGNFGMTTCLSIAGLDHGQVFALDTEMRFYNWDAEVLARMPHLDESIKEFFRLRDSNELPERPWGYENCYHVADTFKQFLGKLQALESDPQS